MTTAEEKQEQVNPEELGAAQKTVQDFVTAFKSFSIYPENHVYCTSNLDKLKNQLETFLDSYEELRLAIHKSTFVYDGEKIFDAPLEESNPAYLLTRDGLIELVFRRGIQPGELVKLLRILNQNMSGSEETGGDIVTSLWQAEFEHIEYDEVDIFALEAFDFDLGSLQVSPDDTSTQPSLTDSPHEEQDQNAIADRDEPEEAQTLAQSETVTNLLNMEQSLNVLELTPEEQATLKRYVEAEEGKDYTNDIIDVLLIILVSQRNEIHFSQVLEFLGSVFFDTLYRGKLDLTDKLCRNIQTIGTQIKKIRPWAPGVIDNLMVMLSDEDVWALLSWMENPQELLADQKNLKNLLNVFRMLPPESMFAMGALIGNIDMSSLHIRNELYELIESKAKKDPEKFGAMLSRSDENVNTILFPIIESLGNMDAASISLQMTSHGSPDVRRMGLEGYFTYCSAPDLEALYPLFNDGSDVVIGKLLTFLLSRVEKEEVERLLLRYLEQAMGEGVKHAHLFEYYKALSMCGSNRSVKVLEKILLESKVSEMFSNLSSVHKKGAALALKAIGSEEAISALNKGKKSLRPDIRMASQFALEKMK